MGDGLTSEKGQLVIGNLRPVTHSDVGEPGRRVWDGKVRSLLEDLDNVSSSFDWMCLAASQMTVDEAQRALLQDKADHDRALRVKVSL